MSYEALFVNATGRTSRSAFVGALVPLLAAILFYHFLVFGRTGQWAMLTLLLPAIVLHARRLHDMGHTAWLLLAPGVPIVAAIWLHMSSPGASGEVAISLIALAAATGVMLWGMIGAGQPEANRYGEAPSA